MKNIILYKVCFAYKLPVSKTQKITSINFKLFYQKSILILAQSKIQTLADNQWHYICVDLYQAYLSENNGTYTKSSLTTFQVNLKLILYFLY